jgi:hypothetical protein
MYTVLLPDCSYFIDDETRRQIMLANSAGVEAITIVPANPCSCEHVVSIDPTRVLAYIAHADIAPAAPVSNIIPFRLHSSATSMVISRLSKNSAKT